MYGHSFDVPYTTIPTDSVYVHNGITPALPSLKQVFPGCGMSTLLPLVLLPETASNHCVTSMGITMTTTSSPPSHYSCISSTGVTGSNEHTNEVGQTVSALLFW